MQETRVTDGRLVYYEHRIVRAEAQHMIHFPHMRLRFDDPYGVPRLDRRRLVHGGTWLTSNSLNCMMQGLEMNFGSISDVLFSLRAMVPRVDGSDKLTDIQPRFQPNSSRHAVIFRFINIQDRHWLALAHFHTINGIVIFDPSGTNKIDQQSDVSLALRSQRAFVTGSQAERPGEESSLICQESQRQTDSWSCGLWCMGFARRLLELLSERRALDGEEIDWEQLRATLGNEMERNNIRRLTLEEAHQLSRAAWTSQQEPNLLY